jgi:hypothetical protein
MPMDQLIADLRAQVRGEVRFDPLSRGSTTPSGSIW